MLTTRSPRILWLLGTTGGLLLWLGASWLQQDSEQQLQRNQQLREAELLVDNAANQLNYALLAGQASSELLLSEHGLNGQSAFQRFAPFILSDNTLFDFVATVRRITPPQRLLYEREQTVILREYRDGRLGAAGERPLYFPVEQQYPENSKALPAQLDLGSQANVDAALQRVSKTGRPAIALIRAGNASRLSAFFSARSRPGDQLLVMGINPGGLISTVPMATDMFRPALPYRLRVLLKDPAQTVILDSLGLAHPRPLQQPALSSTRTIGGQPLIFELYPTDDDNSGHHYGQDAAMLLALAIMATLSGLIVRQSQHSQQVQRQRLQAQGAQNAQLQQQLQRQRQLEDGHKQTILRLRAIVEGSGDAILVIGRDGLIRDLNRAAEAMLGQTRDVLLALPAGALLSELHPTEPALGFEHHVAPRIGRPFEALMICSASQMLQVEVSLTHVVIEQDAVYIAVCRDISARKASEAALIQLKDSLAEQVETQSRQLSALLDASPMAMAYIVELEFKQVNHAFLELFHRREDEIIGQSTRILYDSDEHFARTGRQVYPVLHSGQVSQGEICLLRGDGAPQWVYMYGKAVSADKPALGSIWLYQDISAQRAAEDNLRHAKELAEENSRAKTEFLANMSHELRTPMHAILGFAEMGQNRVERAPADKLRHYFERIHSSGTRLLTLLNDLLDLSKMEVGKMVYTMAPCDVAQVAREAVDELRGMAQRHDVYLQLVVHGNAPLYAEVDAFRIGQVLRNLLGNAIKFSPAGAPVQIDLACDTAANLCLSVRDFGPGVPADERERIFNTFIQSSLTKTGAGGTGLGLAICREIVHAHRGRIEILPVAGRGAHFRVTLPRGSVGASEESA